MTHQNKMILGQKFGKLTVLKKTDIKKHNTYLYLCKCDCGNEKLTKSGELRRGKILSCGCYRIEKIGKLNKLPVGEAAMNGLFGRYLTRAKKAKLDFSIKKEVFKKLIIEPCYYCQSIPKDHAYKTNNGDLIYNGLDRIDNNKGYIMSNIVTCCAECNWMKRLMSVNTFFDKIKTIAKIHKLL